MEEALTLSILAEAKYGGGGKGKGGGGGKKKKGSKKKGAELVDPLDDEAVRSDPKSNSD